MGEWWLAGRYRLIEELGSGGMAVVWRARDTRIDRPVAIKLLRDEYRAPDAAQRFAREASTAGTLNSPHIVVIYDYGTGLLQSANPVDPHSPPTALITPQPPAPGEASREAVYVTMELCAGRTLASIDPAERPLPLPLILRWAVQLCRALEVAHDAGVLHRDIKPANVMVNDRGELKVLDFGIARFMKTLNASATLTRPGAVLGTPAYMSPEQANGNEADIRSDLYSVGCLLYELLTGMPPFGFGEVAGLLFRQVHVPAESPSRARDDLPDAFCDLILALLAKNPDDRPQTAAEVRDLLEALPPVQALPRQVDREAEERLRRRAELARRVAEVSNLQPPEAVALLRELLPAHNREFGHDHGRTLRVRDDLANYLGMSGRRGVAVRMLRQVVLDYGRVLGARHPDTLGARRNLAYWTAKDGDPATAATLLRDLLPDFAPEHGPRDVETLSVRRELALYTGRSGEVEEAVRLLRELVPDLTDALGGDHPRTVEALEELAYWERRATPTRRTG